MFSILLLYIVLFYLYNLSLTLSPFLSKHIPEHIIILAYIETFYIQDI